MGEWLKGEIATRSKQPVRWVIYSHHDCDHSEGAQAFQDTVKEIIAHAEHARERDARHVPDGDADADL